VGLRGHETSYGIPDPDGFMDVIDAKHATLGQLVESETKKFSYTYDFGDDWRHTVTVEDVTSSDPKLSYPRLKTSSLSWLTQTTQSMLTSSAGMEPTSIPPTYPKPKSQLAWPKSLTVSPRQSSLQPNQSDRSTEWGRYRTIAFRLFERGFISCGHCREALNSLL
jgi:hypothetical protein